MSEGYVHYVNHLACAILETIKLDSTTLKMTSTIYKVGIFCYRNPNFNFFVPAQEVMSDTEWVMVHAMAGTNVDEIFDIAKEEQLNRNQLLMTELEELGILDYEVVGNLIFLSGESAMKARLSRDDVVKIEDMRSALDTIAITPEYIEAILRNDRKVTGL